MKYAIGFFVGYIVVCCITEKARTAKAAELMSKIITD